MTFEKKKYEQSLEKGERVSQTNILGKHNPNRGSGLCECPNVSMWLLSGKMQGSQWLEWSEPRHCVGV